MLCLLPRYTWFPNGQAHYDGPPLGLSWHDSGDHLPEDKERLLRDFDSASFSSDPFNMPFTATTDGNYLSTQNGTYANQEEGRDQRVGGLASIMSVNNGVRYHAPQPALQDVHYTNPSALAMASSDSCSEPFALNPASLYPHVPHQQYSFDRLTDYRRVSPLHPPSSMSTNMQSPIHSMGNNTAALMGRNHVYSAPFTIQRSMNMPLNGMNDLPRGHGYSGPPQAVEIPERNQAVLLQPSSPESSQRSHSAGVEQPAFEETSVLKQLIADFGGTQQIVKPEIYAKFVRGPFPSEDKWTCYRRNYLSVTCSVSLQPWAANLPLYLRHGDRDLEPIHSFSMGISAIVNGNYEQRVALVQHTPKRDKQSEHSPPRVIVQPIPPISLSSSNGNGVHGLHLGSHSLDYNGPFPGATQPPQSHLFERIQFQKATANNGKRRAQQQFYNLVVELYAEVSGSLESRTQSVLIARRHSESLVVRGRSPGHYRDGRRDSTASSGPGSGPDGRGGDGSVNSIPSQALGAGARQQPMLYDSSPQGSYTYARVDYRHMPAMEHSPVGDSPLAPSSSSSGFDYAMGNDTMNPLDTLKPGSSLDPYQDVPDSFPGVSSHPRSAGNGFDPVYSSFPTYSGMQNNRG